MLFAAIFPWLLHSQIVMTKTSSGDGSMNIDSTEAESSTSLRSMMQQPLASPEEIFPKALSIINSMEQAPSCHRLATATLITSCRSLEEGPHDGSTGTRSHEKDLDSVKSSFAARLAICELKGARAAVPDHCLPFTPRERGDDFFHRIFKSNKGWRGSAEQPELFGYGEFTLPQLDKCLTALESRPQWWTSYSNARQNAIIVCHAARHEVEKNEVVNLHRSMTGVVSDLSHVLSLSTKQSHKILEDQRAFQKAALEFQVKLLKDLELSKQGALIVFEKLIIQAEEKLQHFGATILEYVKRAKVELDELSQSINHLVHVAKKGNQDLIVAHADALHNHQVDSIAQHELLESLKDIEMKTLVGMIASIRSDLQGFKENISLVNHKQNALDERFTSLDQVIRHIQRNAEVVLQSQAEQSKSQSRLSLLLQDQLNITEYIISESSAGIAKIDAAIDQTTAKIFNMSKVYNMFLTGLRWFFLTLIGLSVFICLILRIVIMISPL